MATQQATSLYSGRDCGNSFYIQDPKVRHIRKARVEDRIVHQAVYSALELVYEPVFIHHAYSSHIGKGTHRAVNALQAMMQKVRKNFSRPCWALKCDIRKFYDSVDHQILMGLLSLDQFVKHDLRVKFYLRYADDFLFLSSDKGELEMILPRIKQFLNEKLNLELHPQKIILRPLKHGIDFIGYVTLPHHRTLRTTTRKRMFRKLSEKSDFYFKDRLTNDSYNQSLQSYLGLLSHADAYHLQETIKNVYHWQKEFQ